LTKVVQRSREQFSKHAANPPVEKRSRAQRQAQKKHYDEVTFRYALSVLFSDLIEELDYAILEQLFDDSGQRILRRIIRRLGDARMLSYKLTEPEEPPEPVEEPSVELVRAFSDAKETIH
jgi:hypothetical protein